MKQQLRSGIPSEWDYKRLIESDDFREMESFSERFLTSNRSILQQYAKKWVRDSLHQWSRQWEYPYVFSSLESSVISAQTLRILDAGSGITFFPYYVKEKFEPAEVYCCDSDQSLTALYRTINDGVSTGVAFSNADMRKTPYEDDWFDAVYCISVLEHTIDFEEIIDDFHRVLKPGGRLIVTFDISLDGTRDISPERAAKLLYALNKKFDMDDGPGSRLATDILDPAIFTTMSANRMDASLLPWKYPAIFYRFKAIMSGRKSGSWPPLLTAYCLSLTKS